MAKGSFSRGAPGKFKTLRRGEFPRINRLKLSRAHEARHQRETVSMHPTRLRAVKKLRDRSTDDNQAAYKVEGWNPLDTDFEFGKRGPVLQRKKASAFGCEPETGGALNRTSHT
jgi:hypothetical protein